MNKINYQIKYIEYLLRKCRTILTNDISFHADRLREISGTYPDLLNPVTVSYTHLDVYKRKQNNFD
ncbi:hypothetical protein AZ010_002158 [Klebsiella pneumoniae]|nr:hypothetical protein AZ010_002158 [Klebsiella pneumoniae]